jgi:RNA polymerase sigma-70 factor, ECF subfamily
MRLDGRMKGATWRPKRSDSLSASSPQMPDAMRIVASEGVPVDAYVSTWSSFEGFFEELAPTLFRRLYLITGDRGEAEEIMQDSFIVVFERWDRVQQMEDPEGYLYRVAFNTHRRHRRRAETALLRTLHIKPPVDEFGAVETRTVIAAGLAALTPRQRAALVLTELLGYSSEEAGSIMKVRSSTVRVLAHQGRATMRRHMGDPDA